MVKKYPDGYRLSDRNLIIKRNEISVLQISIFYESLNQVQRGLHIVNVGLVDPTNKFTKLWTTLT